MNIVLRRFEGSRIECGFKSKNQLPLFMVWRVWFDETGEVYSGKVLFNSMDWIKI